MLAVTAIVAAIAVSGIVAMAIPQQALAGGHHHHNNGIKVNQSIDQANVCSGPQQVVKPQVMILESSTVCLNQGSNNADIQR